MADTTKETQWTLMFYFASDNPLAPGVVSQLKALKNAGYHHGANVIAYFDPQTPGTPTHTFDVNAIEKLKDPNNKVGYTGFKPNDSFVRSMMPDKLWDKELSRDGSEIRDLVIQQQQVHGREFNPPRPPSYRDVPGKTAAATGNGTDQKDTDAHKDADQKGEQGPKRSLTAFLDFCAQNYQANHYMLFILGHGLIVGDDVFLYDEHSDSHSLTLKALGEVLKEFRGKIQKQNSEAEFELASFHSCSMSSLELAYELRDSANYMLAAQGPAFVGSWPYTQILMRIFNEIDRSKAEPEAAGDTDKGASTGKKTVQARSVEPMLQDLFDYVLHNSTDFMLAGYSFDLCLCDLRTISNSDAEERIRNFASALTLAVADSALKNCILLAHWKAQSYWQENYTDFYDFCFCLSECCDAFATATGNAKPFEDLQQHCIRVMEVLAKRSTKHPDNGVRRAEFAGPDAQYSHGLSVYFPWAAPTADKTIARQYEGSKEQPGYQFNVTGWYNFLKQYWGENPGDGTKREVHRSENDAITRSATLSKDDELLEDMASLMFNEDGPLSTKGALDDDPQPVKTRPTDPTGDDCSCGSIKNYPHDTRSRRQRSGIAFDQLPPSSTSFL